MSKRRGSYAFNSCANGNGYNKTISKTNLEFTQKPGYAQMSDYESPYVLSGGQYSPAVWVNNSYNVAEEDPGLSWVL